MKLYARQCMAKYLQPSALDTSDNVSMENGQLPKKWLEEPTVIVGIR